MVITISQARKRRHSDVKSLADKGSDTEWCNGDLNPGRLIPEPGSCLVWDGTCPEMAERESPFSLLSLTISADQQSDPRLPPHPPSPLPSLWRLCLLSPWLCGSWANLRELRPRRQEPWGSDFLPGSAEDSQPQLLPLESIT